MKTLGGVELSAALLVENLGQRNSCDRIETRSGRSRLDFALVCRFWRVWDRILAYRYCGTWQIWLPTSTFPHSEILEKKLKVQCLEHRKLCNLLASRPICSMSHGVGDAPKRAEFARWFFRISGPPRPWSGVVCWSRICSKIGESGMKYVRAIAQDSISPPNGYRNGSSPAPW